MEGSSAAHAKDAGVIVPCKDETSYFCLPQYAQLLFRGFSLIQASQSLCTQASSQLFTNASELQDDVLPDP